MIDKKLLIKHFSKNAANYDLYANVQKKMAVELIDSVKKNKMNLSKIPHILDVGCGTGYLTEQLIKRFPESFITAVDIAPGMIKVAKERFAGQNIRFICGDIEEMDLDTEYDLIISNAAFQWFNRLDGTIKKLIGMLNGRGVIYFSTFGNHTFNELHQSFHRAKKVLEIDTDILTGQKLYSLCDLQEQCYGAVSDYCDSGFLITGNEKFEYEYFDSVKEFLESIKKIGANNSNKEQGNKGHGNNVTLTKRMMEIYEKDFKEKDKIKATYHCVFLSILKQANDIEEIKEKVCG